MNVAYNGMLLSGRFSGVEVCIHELFRHLERRDEFRYTLYAPRSFGAGGGARTRVVHPGVRTAGRLLRIAWEQLALPGRLRRDGAALLHAPGYVMPLGSPVPTVVTVYDTQALDHPEWCTPSNRLHYGLLLPRSVRRARRVIVPSSATQADVCRLFPGAAGKVRVVAPGVRLGGGVPRDPARRAEFRRRNGLDEGYILFLGNVEPRKNLPMLIRAFHMARAEGALRQKLVIAGEAGWGQSAVERDVVRLGLAGEVRFWGYVAEPDLSMLYAAADAFVFPSLQEGFGLPVLEAMACGTPVIVSDRGALPEVAGEAAMVVPADRPEAWARALGELVADSERQASLRAKGEARARAFTWDEAARLTETVYREVLAECRPGSPWGQP